MTPMTAAAKNPPIRYYCPLYVLGLAFPERTMGPIAEALCTAEEIRGRGSHHAAVVYQMRKNGTKQTIVPVVDPETKNTYYFWVLACSPSVNGGQPPRGLQGLGTAILRHLGDCGVEKTFLNTFVEQMVEWPRNLVQPVWVPEKVEETKQAVRAASARVTAMKTAEVP